jgi:hypothetical protein
MSSLPYFISPFVKRPLYRQSKGLDKATLSEDRYISKRLQKHLGGYMAHELGIAEIRSFLDRYRKNF